MKDAIQLKKRMQLYLTCGTPLQHKTENVLGTNVRKTSTTEMITVGSNSEVLPSFKKGKKGKHRRSFRHHAKRRRRKQKTVEILFISHDDLQACTNGEGKETDHPSEEISNVVDDQGLNSM